MDNDRSVTLGRRIKERRKQLGLSLRDLAEQAGVTASFLSQLERGHSNPSIKSLQAITKTLNVSIFYLLVEDNSDRHYLVRNGQGRRFALSDSNVDLEMFSPGPHSNRKMLAFVGRLQPGYDQEVIPARQTTEECIHVLEGCLQVDLVDASYTLDPGDSVTFDGMSLQRLKVIGDRTTVYLSFSTPPFV